MAATYVLTAEVVWKFYQVLDIHFDGNYEVEVIKILKKINLNLNLAFLNDILTEMLVFSLSSQEGKILVIKLID